MNPYAGISFDDNQLRVAAPNSFDFRRDTPMLPGPTSTSTLPKENKPDMNLEAMPRRRSRSPSLSCTGYTTEAVQEEVVESKRSRSRSPIRVSQRYRSRSPRPRRRSRSPSAFARSFQGNQDNNNNTSDDNDQATADEDQKEVKSTWRASNESSRGLPGTHRQGQRGRTSRRGSRPSRRGRGGRASFPLGMSVPLPNARNARNGRNARSASREPDDEQDEVPLHEQQEGEERNADIGMLQPASLFDDGDYGAPSPDDHWCWMTDEQVLQDDPTDPNKQIVQMVEFSKMYGLIDTFRLVCICEKYYNEQVRPRTNGRAWTRRSIKKWLESQATPDAIRNYARRTLHALLVIKAETAVVMRDPITGRLVENPDGERGLSSVIRSLRQLDSSSAQNF